jgi:predicted metallo-beta-lactamase superfamily hydrolase
MRSKRIEINLRGKEKEIIILRGWKYTAFSKNFLDLYFYLYNDNQNLFYGMLYFIKKLNSLLNENDVKKIIDKIKESDTIELIEELNIF